MAMVPAAVVRGATTTELKALPASSFDPRGYGYYQQQQHVLGAASAASPSHYSEQPPQGQQEYEYHHQTALHLGYHVKIDSAEGFL